MVPTSAIQSSESQKEQFDRAFEMLQTLVDFQEADEMFPQRAHTVFTASVVLWMLVYQRLKPDASLENAVKHLIDTRPSYLPENKRLQEKPAFNQIFILQCRPQSVASGGRRVVHKRDLQVHHFNDQANLWAASCFHH